MMGNWFKTGLLMAAIVALFGSVGALLGGGQGMVLALALGLGINLWAYWFSDTMVLRLYRAQEVDARTAPELYGTVKELAEGAALPMPRVYLIDEAQPNAFATGRNPEHAAIAATTGILQLLNARELRAVLGHELTHVKHRDILTSTVTASIAGAISTLAQFSLFFGGRNDDNRNPVVALLVLILAPIAAMLIQLAISRARGYEARESSGNRGWRRAGRPRPGSRARLRNVALPRAAESDRPYACRSAARRRERRSAALDRALPARPYQRSGVHRGRLRSAGDLARATHLSQRP